jgi:hypothetical protein
MFYRMKTSTPIVAAAVMPSLWLVLAAGLLLCDRGEAPRPSAAGSGSDSTKADSLQAAKREARRIEHPILTAARKNPHFDAGKWLKSDHRFFARPNPTQLSPYDKIIQKMARRYGFDWRMIAAQIFTESNFREDAASGAGAVGLMQVLPSTAAFMGADTARLLNPEINIAVGCMYNQRLYSLWKRQTDNREQRLAFALASYNAGRRRVLRTWQPDTLNRWRAVYPLLPRETQNYVHKIYLKWHFYRDHFLP